MKKNIHPKNYKIKITCICGNNFETNTTLKENLKIEICNKCHPFYSGKQKIIDIDKRIDKFYKRFNKKNELVTPAINEI